MDTATMIKIVVFGVAAFIVLVFVLSGVHFARAVYLNQLLQRERAARREMMISALAADRGNVAVVEIKEKDGFIIIQPDGMENLALRIESEDERAFKKLAEQAYAEHEAEKKLEILRHSSRRSSMPSSSRDAQSAPQSPVCESCGRNRAPTIARTESHEIASSNEVRTDADRDSEPGGSMICTQNESCSNLANAMSNSSQEAFSAPPATDVRSVTLLDTSTHSIVNDQSSPRNDSRGSQQISAPTTTSASHDPESNVVDQRAKPRALRYLKSAKRWFMSTDSYFD